MGDIELFKKTNKPKIYFTLAHFCFLYNSPLGFRIWYVVQWLCLKLTRPFTKKMSVYTNFTMYSYNIVVNNLVRTCSTMLIRIKVVYNVENGMHNILIMWREKTIIEYVMKISSIWIATMVGLCLRNMDLRCSFSKALAF